MDGIVLTSDLSLLSLRYAIWQSSRKTSSNFPVFFLSRKLEKLRNRVFSVTSVLMIVFVPRVSCVYLWEVVAVVEMRSSRIINFSLQCPQLVLQR